MMKSLKRLVLCAAFCTLLWGWFLIRDHRTLKEQVIRFHVTANSDSAEDQSVKLAVRDAVLASMESDLKKIQSKEAAALYLQQSIPKLEKIANQILKASGFTQTAVIRYAKEAFPVRHYDTFSLPSGVYDTLRIIIGEGNGNNWWCVSFPSLCLSAGSADFTEAAAGAGFYDSLIETLSEPGAYSVRFYFLDTLGKLENYLFAENGCPFF